MYLRYFYQTFFNLIWRFQYIDYLRQNQSKNQRTKQFMQQSIMSIQQSTVFFEPNMSQTDKNEKRFCICYVVVIKQQQQPIVAHQV